MVKWFVGRGVATLGTGTNAGVSGFSIFNQFQAWISQYEWHLVNNVPSHAYMYVEIYR